MGLLTRLLVFFLTLTAQDAVLSAGDNRKGLSVLSWQEAGRQAHRAEIHNEPMAGFCLILLNLKGLVFFFFFPVGPKVVAREILKKES